MKTFKGDQFEPIHFYGLGLDKNNGFALGAAQVANEKTRDFFLHYENLIKEARQLLKYRYEHDEDCADATEPLYPEYEECECGASSIIHFLNKTKDIV